VVLARIHAAENQMIKGRCPPQHCVLKYSTNSGCFYF
jgi:hypothetical protein